MRRVRRPATTSQATCLVVVGEADPDSYRHCRKLKPTLTYQDAHHGKSFRGDEIRAVECDLGTLVSVTLRMTVDAGSTSLGLVIPRMRINQGEHVAVHQGSSGLSRKRSMFT